MSTSFRFQFPLLAAGQAQKEVTHNEAVQGIDRLLHLSVKTRLLDSPPAIAAVGECWIVGAQAAGDWAGMADAIAVYEGFGWAFVMPTSGMMAWVEDEDAVAVWNGGWSIGWPVRQFELGSVPVVSNPVGGAIVDNELRQSFSALLSGLQQLGLVA